MNKTEAEYSTVLMVAKSKGEIEDYSFESVTFKLGPDLRYTPDFMVTALDGTIDFHEVKGSQRAKVVEIGKPVKTKPRMEDDARVKYIVAAEKFWQFRFALAYKADGAWRVEYAD